MPYQHAVTELPAARVGRHSSSLKCCASMPGAVHCAAYECRAPSFQQDAWEVGAQYPRGCQAGGSIQLKLLDWGYSSQALAAVASDREWLLLHGFPL